MLHRHSTWLAAALMLSAASVAQAGGGATAGAPCGVHYVQKTVMCPTYVTQYQTVWCTEYRTRPEKRTYKVRRCVPVTTQVQQKIVVSETRYVTHDVKCQVRVPVTTWVDQKYHVRVPVYHDEQVPVTVLVPDRIKRQGVRKVPRTIPVQSERIVCRDAGHWVTKMVPVCRRHHRRCGCSTTCLVPQKCWVSKIVRHSVPVTTYKCVWENEPFEYYETVCKPVKQMQTVRRCSYKLVEHTRKVPVCSYRIQETVQKVTRAICVPKTITRMVPVTTYKTVIEDHTDEIQVCVPVRVKKQVPVQVCKMVPRTVSVPVYHGCSCCR